MSRAADLIAVRLVFASGEEEANRRLVRHVATLTPVLKLIVVAEFPPVAGEWVPWHILRSNDGNLKSLRAALEGCSVEIAAFLTPQHKPLRGMKFAAMRCRAKRVVAFDDTLQAIPMSIAGLPSRIRHAAGRTQKMMKVQFSAEGRGRKWLQRIANPSQAEIPYLACKAQLYAAVMTKLRTRRTEHRMRVAGTLLPGVSVIIPSRDGLHLLKILLPTLLPQLPEGEVIVSDNGSSDGTSQWLAIEHPRIRVISTAMPLSFARAVNAGVLEARYSHVFLLNNDMVLEQGCVASLQAAFERVHGLFCATAQIFFPEGARREETGKAVWRTEEPRDFPVRCDTPIEGEDLTWVLYGSGGCSLLDTEKLRALGGVAEVYEPAYVEDMDFGYRAWKRGWPTVYCSGAKVEHRHRATTSRFFSEDRLQFFVERNYLRFLIWSVGSPLLFRSLWDRAIRRLQLLAMKGDAAALATLRNVPAIAALPEKATGALSEEAILALGNGDLAVFPGRGPTFEPIVIVSPYVPYPLSHGGAVRIFNLMKECSLERGLVLVCFVDALATPPQELLDLCAEVVVVQRHGSHYRKDTDVPDTIEEFRSDTFEAALRMTVAKWHPRLVQLEFTQMAQYAGACHPAKTLLVEHDITFDLMEQLLAASQESAITRTELAGQLQKWKTFETNAWKQVDCVITMSEKDRNKTAGAKLSECIPNGVDTERFQPSQVPAEAKRLLFIGSFQHLPNQLGLAWFLDHVWPLLGGGWTLHVIAGMRYDYYQEFYRGQVRLNLGGPGIEVDGFVSDVRPAYRQAQMVIVPLIASAGTNIKVLEAMAMGKPVVSTSAGINGLDLRTGEEIALAADADEFARQVKLLAANADARLRISECSRKAVLGRYDWSRMGRLQSELYRRLQG